jgi:hypothetical protein
MSPPFVSKGTTLGILFLFRVDIYICLVGEKVKFLAVLIRAANDMIYLLTAIG